MRTPQSDGYSSENFDVRADGRKTGKTGVLALMGLITVTLMALISAGCAGPVDSMGEQVVTTEQAITSEQTIRDYPSLSELDFLEFGTYSLNWIRYGNVDQNGAIKLSSDGATFFPFFYAVTDRSVVLEDLENRQTLERLVDGRVVLSNVEAIDGFCETTTLAGISTDLFCQLGRKMPEGHFSLVLYDSETLEVVALTTTIDNVNNATERFTSELQDKARFADLTAVKETLATARASVTAEDSATLGDSEPGHTNSNGATPTPVPSVTPTRSTVVTQTNTPTATNTPIRSNPPTSTPVPPAAATSTPIRSNPPTNTPVPPAPTNTSVPPTATNTPVPPAPTNTPVPPTATNTSVPPTATNTPVPPTATNTPLPTPTPTNTPDVGDVPSDPGEGRDTPKEPEPEPEPDPGEECTSPLGCEGDEGNE